MTESIENVKKLISVKGIVQLGNVINAFLEISKGHSSTRKAYQCFS